jgi:predicted Zn-dependent peptidase
MLSLAFSPRSLEVQKGVVVEEFRQRYLNQPYGDAMHHLRSLAYQAHSYRWPTIGSEIRHIEEATLEDVRAFFFKWYRPSNAILVVTGDLEWEKVLDLSRKWFASIEGGNHPVRTIPAEPEQLEGRRLETEASVPMTALYKAWPMAGRTDPEFYEANLLTDILGQGKSSRLVHTLVKEERIFHSLSFYVTGTIDPGLLIFEGKINPGHSVEEAEARLTEELEKLKAEGFSDEEVEKVRNQSETALAGAEVESLYRALHLAYFTLLGDPDGFQKELGRIRAVTRTDLENCFRRLIRPSRENTLVYKALPG